MPVSSSSTTTEPPIGDDYDVVVVGARAAGAATAMLLARDGVRVLAVDRSAYGSDTLSTHAIASPGVLQLSRWGVLDDLRRAGTPTIRTAVYHYGTDRRQIDIRPRGDVDGLYAPRRTLLDATLVDHARAAGAEIRHGISVATLTRDENDRVDGVEIDVDGTRRRVGARFVVGADGMRSPVAAAVGARTTFRESVGSAQIYAYWEGLPSDVVENFLQPGRAASIIPTNDGAAAVWVAMQPEMFQDVARGNLAPTYHGLIGTFPELADRLRPARRIGGYRGFAGVPGYLREPWGAGWALVGDAGYFKDPVGSHGITDAFIGAELLADALTEVILAGRSEQNALGRYGATRDALAAQLMPPTAFAATLPRDLRAAEQAFVDMSLAMRDELQMLLARDRLDAVA